MKRDGSTSKGRIKELHEFVGFGRKRCTEISSGDICAVVGIEGLKSVTPLQTRLNLKHLHQSLLMNLR